MQSDADKLYISGGYVYKVSENVEPQVSQNNTTSLKKYTFTLPDDVTDNAPVAALSATSPSLSYVYGVNGTKLKGKTLNSYLPDNITNVTIKIGDKYYSGAVASYTSTLAESDIAGIIKITSAGTIASKTGTATVTFESEATAPSSTSELLVFKNGTKLISGTDYNIAKKSATEYTVTFTENAALTKQSVITIGAERTGYITEPNVVAVQNNISGFDAVKGTHYTASSNAWSQQFTITAKSGYSVSTSKTSGFGGSLSFSNDTATGSVTFYVKDAATGEISSPATESYKIDKTAPTASMTVKGVQFNTQSGDASYTIFAKNSLSVPVTSTDATSKIAKTEYQKVSSIDQFNENGTWTSFKDTISFTENGSFVLFVRVTDNAGNKKIINSTQIVLYKDSTATTSQISSIIGDDTDKTATVGLNGNTISSIKADGQILDTSNYTIVNNVITLKGSYIKTLSLGNHTVSVAYNPQNEEYSSEQDKGDVPSETSFTIKITKQTQNKPQGITTTAPTTYKNNDGTILNVSELMEYQKDGSATWISVTGTSVTGLSAGTYNVRYKETATQSAGDAVNVTITPFPTTLQTLSNGKAQITGNFTNGATLNISPITGTNEYNSIVKLINTQKNRVIGAYEVTVTNGAYDGKIQLTFDIGVKYNGQTITIYHKKKNGQVENLSAVCKNGKITVTVDELSPFVLTEQIVNTTPGISNAAPTGDNGNLIQMLIMLILSGIGITAVSARIISQKRKIK